MGCKYAEGRASGAPQLRRELDTRNQGILACETELTDGPTVEHRGRRYPAVWYEGRYVPEAYPHPPSSLPHLLEGNLDVLFPLAVAGEELVEVNETEDPLEERGAKIGKQANGSMPMDKDDAKSEKKSRTVTR